MAQKKLNRLQLYPSRTLSLQGTRGKEIARRLRGETQAACRKSGLMAQHLLCLFLPCLAVRTRGHVVGHEGLHLSGGAQGTEHCGFSMDHKTSQEWQTQLAMASCHNHAVGSSNVGPAVLKYFRHCLHGPLQILANANGIGNGCPASRARDAPPAQPGSFGNPD